jgi:predicted transcriptional regulator of viral defense system
MQTFDKIFSKGDGRMEEYKDKKYISREFLYAKGYSQYKVNRLTEDGDVLKINRRYFENPDYTGDADDNCAVNAYAPEGVICLVSAAIYHELTTSRPLQIDVALPRRSRVPESPVSPRMRFYLFSEDRYFAGIDTIDEDGNSFMIYDREKTVCDVLFYRNKLGFETAIEILKNYLERPDRDLNRLMSYAKMLRSEKLLREYLEVMI